MPACLIQLSECLAAIITKLFQFFLYTPPSSVMTMASAHNEVSCLFQFCSVKKALDPSRDLECRTDICLSLWVVEARGLVSKKR